MERADIVLYVEDPGAANFVAGLPAAVAREGPSVSLLAGGMAAEQLAALGEVFEPVEDGDDAAAGLIRRVDALHPRLVAVGTSENVDSPALSLVDHARRAGIASVGLVDGPSNADHRFRGRSGRPLGHAPDWIVVADEAVRRRFVELGAASERVLVGGHPRYDAVLALGEAMARADRAALCRRHFADAGPGEKVVVFLAELSDGVNPHLYHRMPSYSLHGRGDHDGRTEIVLEEVLDALGTIAPRPRLVLRLHPKNARREFEAWADEIDGFSAGGPSDALLEMLYAADLVVGLSTILLMEAALAGCRTLSVLPRQEETEWLPAIALGLTPCVTDRAGLRAALQSALAENSPALPDPAVCVPPGAVERVTGILCRLAAGPVLAEAEAGR
jgi:hypothetical protein